MNEVHSVENNEQIEQQEQEWEAEQEQEVPEVPETPAAKQHMGVGAVSKALILRAYNEGKNITNEDLALKVQQIFANAGVSVKTSAACIAWYKSKMRVAKQLPKTGGSKGIEIDIDDIEL